MPAITRKIPILMYHEISPSLDKTLQSGIQHSFILSTGQFDQQMRYMAENNFQTLTLDEAFAMLYQKEATALPARAVVITFDDGFLGNFHYVLPILLDYGQKATFFITVNKIGQPLMMEWQHLRLLMTAGMSVQSHCMNHIFLGGLDDQQSMHELANSKIVLENKLETDVHFISLPNGSYHARFPELARRAGYRGACCSDIGYCDSTCNPFLLRRISIKRGNSLHDLADILNGGDKYLAKARSRQRLRKSLEAIAGEKLLNKLYHLAYGVKP
jgi:peptidoglycan/xylan/chitin deacetylase (PgdA/CDA1 family)